jgi:tRNA nucleotidyltransferase (CCA-adding enzyme)
LLEAKELLRRVSGDRIRHDLDRIFDEENAPQMMDRLHQLTILKAIHPDLEWDDKLSDLVKSLPNKELPAEWNIEDDITGSLINRALIYVVWLMRSPEKSGVSQQLRLTSSLALVIDEAARLRESIHDLEKKSPSQITIELDRIPNMAIYGVYLDEDEPKYKGFLSRYLSSWQHVEANITGKDLQEAGLAPGPIYTEILSKIRNAWLDEEISTKKEEKVLFKALLKEAKKDLETT